MLEGFGRGPYRDGLDVVGGEQAGRALSQDGIVFDDQHAAELLGGLGFEVLDRFEELFALDGLERISDRAHLERSLCVIGG